MLHVAVASAPAKVLARLERCGRALGMQVSVADPKATRTDVAFDLLLVYGLVDDGRVRRIGSLPNAALRVGLIDGPTTPAQAMAAGVDDVLQLDVHDDVLIVQLGSLAERAAHRQQTSPHAPSPSTWGEYKLETLGTVVGGMAHDFNNLLTTVLANAKLLERELGSEPSRQHVERIEQAARKAARLTEELLVYAGRRQIDREPVEFDQVLTDALASLSGPVPDSVRLQIDTNTKVHRFYGDARLVTTALVALVENAIEACLPGGGTVRIRWGTVDLDAPPTGAFTSRGAEPGAYVFMQVADDGQGIAPEHLPRVMDPFFTTKPHGRGLGLATVLGVARAHRGAVEIESVPGQGTLVRLLFPVDPPESASDSAAALPVIKDRPGVTVLACDDEPHLLTTLERLLRQFDFHVLTATSAEEALVRLRKEGDRIHVVLFDLGLADGPGPGALRRLRDADPSVPIVFMSGMRDPAAEPAIEADPRAEFVLKPFDPLALVQRLGDMARRVS